MGQVLYNASVLLDAVDISACVDSVNLDTGNESLDSTTMGQTTKIFTPGLKTWSASLNLKNNFASDSYDDMLTPFNAFGTTFTFSIKPTATAGDPDNPEWSGQAFIGSYNPLSGAVGELAKSAVSIIAAGPLTRATATS